MRDNRPFDPFSPLAPMSLGTLDRNPPPLFKQGASALSQLAFYAALALFIMVADARFDIVHPLRAGLATALYPVQWVLLQPIAFVRERRAWFESVRTLEASERQAHKRLAEQSARALRAAQLEQENRQLLGLLGLRERTPTPGRAAEVLYFSADPFRRQVVIDKGQLHGVASGSPVIDENGVLGQVTRVYPMVSEVTLLIDRNQAIPVLNTRTRARSIAYGEAGVQGGGSGGLELRFMLGSADFQVGDLLVTSGGDGVYPAGLPVARVDKVDRRADSTFARIHCTPLAQAAGVRYVLTLEPTTTDLLPSRTKPADEPAPSTRQKPKAGSR